MCWYLVINNEVGLEIHNDGVHTHCDADEVNDVAMGVVGLHLESARSVRLFADKRPFGTFGQVEVVVVVLGEMGVSKQTTQAHRAYDIGATLLFVEIFIAPWRTRFTYFFWVRWVISTYSVP